MPVTAKLSKLFYERLGDQVANELVDWFNKVDESYKDDVRKMNQLNFEVFDAKLDQRVVQADAKIDRVTAELNARIDALAAEMRIRFDQTATKSDIADLGAAIERRLGDQMRWIYAGLATLLIPTVGTLIGVWRR